MTSSEDVATIYGEDKAQNCIIFLVEDNWIEIRSKHANQPIYKRSFLDRNDIQNSTHLLISCLTSIFFLIN